MNESIEEIREAIKRHQRMLAVCGGDPMLVRSEADHVIYETLEGVALSSLPPEALRLLVIRVQGLVVGPLLVSLSLASTLEKLHDVDRAEWQRDLDTDLDATLERMSGEDLGDSESP